MRISDWSSDVCSSDLFAPVNNGRNLARATQAAARTLALICAGFRDQNKILFHGNTPKNLKNPKSTRPPSATRRRGTDCTEVRGKLPGGVRRKSTYTELTASSTQLRRIDRQSKR